jgi:hypothetical protein
MQNRQFYLGDTYFKHLVSHLDVEVIRDCRMVSPEDRELMTKQHCSGNARTDEPRVLAWNHTKKQTRKK